MRSPHFGWRLMLFGIAMFAASSRRSFGEPPAGYGEVAPNVPAIESVAAIDPGAVDAFPRLLRWRPPRLQEAPGGDALAHFIICELTVDTSGNGHTVRVLGCEGAKELLCDSLLAALRTARFLPARAGGKVVTATVVIGATFSAGDTTVGVLGVPVVGAWQDSLCAWHGRIYGSDELDLADRPFVTKRVAAIRPGSAHESTGAAVRLKLVVDPDGEPCFILCEAASPSDQGFVEAAVAAAWQYRFQPGRLHGIAEAVWVSLDFRWE